MNTILLTQGYVAVVDDDDYELVSQYNWYAHKNGNTFYAETNAPVGDVKRTTIKMHRLILGLTDPKIHVDHINGDGLDNQRANLRACSHKENLWNQGKQKNNTSGYKGVYWHKASQKWAAGIRSNGKSIHLGLFTTPEAAYDVYYKAAAELHGTFANGGN